MKIHHLRNATFIIESGKNHILVDPMLSNKSKFPPFAFLKHKAQRNPTVALPESSDALLDKVTHCLITHCQKKHIDHLDPAGENFLRKNNIPVICHEQDFDYLTTRGINAVKGLSHWKTDGFFGGKITAIPAQHGHGWIHKIMANGIGFYIEIQGEPSIYISGDTVLTENVKRALAELQPDIAVVACGSASVDVGKPILMSEDEILEFTRLAPKLVFANHLESLNHCPMTRAHMAQALTENNLLNKIWMPDDGGSTEIKVGELFWKNIN